MDIAVSPQAEKFIRRLLRFDGAPGCGFRLLVRPGGCSGLTAEFSIEKEPRSGEAAIEVSGIKLFLPAESRLLLDGVTIDFVETPLQSGFVFHDPNKNACGSCDLKEVTAAAPGLTGG